MCLRVLVYFVLSRTTLVRRVAPFWEPSMRSVLSLALSLASFLDITTSLKGKYKLFLGHTKDFYEKGIQHSVFGTADDCLW